MYYSSGNYEAFAHPKKPEGVDNKSAYLIGSGLAALTAACYLSVTARCRATTSMCLRRTAARRCLRWLQVRYRLCHARRP